MAGIEIFISYRRSDAAGHARALHRDLCARFEAPRIFFDRESIESGDVFPDRLKDGISASRVVLALIGPDWLEAKDAQVRRRLDQPEDFVRREIALALGAGKKVIPVLFDDTPPPPASKLPDEMNALAACDVLTLRGKNYEYETQLAELVRLIARVPGVSPPRSADRGGSPVPADRYRITALLDKRVQTQSFETLRDMAPDKPLAFVLVGSGEEWPAALLDRLAYELDALRFPAPEPLKAPCTDDPARVEALLHASLAKALGCEVREVAACLTEPDRSPVYYVTCSPDDAPDPRLLVALLEAWERLPLTAPVPARVLLLIVESQTEIGWPWTRLGRRRRLEKLRHRLGAELQQRGWAGRLLPSLASPHVQDVTPWVDFCVRKLLPTHAEPIADFTTEIFKKAGKEAIPHSKLKQELTRHEPLWPAQSRIDL